MIKRPASAEGYHHPKLEVVRTQLTISPYNIAARNVNAPFPSKIIYEELHNERFGINDSTSVPNEVKVVEKDHGLKTNNTARKTLKSLKNKSKEAFDAIMAYNIYKYVTIRPKSAVSAGMNKRLTSEKLTASPSKQSKPQSKTTSVDLPPSILKSKRTTMMSMRLRKSVIPLENSGQAKKTVNEFTIDLGNCQHSVRSSYGSMTLVPLLA